MVAALLDLGADKEVLQKALKSLNVTGFEIEISRVLKSGIDACDFNVILDAKYENHDHDIEYLHGNDKDEMNVTHNHLVHKEHEHRGLSEIIEVINYTACKRNCYRYIYYIGKGRSKSSWCGY